MRYFNAFFVTVLAVLSYVEALTITSPSTGTVDPGQSITVSWTSTSSDPSTFSLMLHSTSSNSLFPDQTVDAAVSTSRGSYVIPANTLLAYGTGFVIRATDQTGSVLGTSSAFILAIGSNQVTTASNGQVSLATSNTAVAAAPSTVDDTPGASTTSGASSASVSGPASTFVSAATSTSTESSNTSATSDATSTSTSESSSATSRATSSSSSFTTSTASRTSSQSRTATSTTASSTASTNAQGRLDREGGMMAAGVLAGLVALVM